MGQKSRRGLAGSYGLKAVISLIEVKFLDRLMVSSTGLTGERFLLNPPLWLLQGLSSL